MGGDSAAIAGKDSAPPAEVKWAGKDEVKVEVEAAGQGLRLTACGIGPVSESEPATGVGLGQAVIVSRISS